MKTAFITLWIILFGSTLATGQVESVVGLRPDTRHIKLYRVTVKTMTGEKIRGIFYTMTDSTLVFFADNQATIRQFRAGYLPELDTIKASDVKRISIRRKSHFLRQTTIGVGLGAAFLELGALLINSRDGIGAVSFGFFISYLVAPAMVVGGMGQGFIPRCTERIRGNTNLFEYAHDHLAWYTIANQQSQLDVRTRTTR